MSPPSKSPSSPVPGLEARADIDRDVLSRDGEGDGDVRSARRRSFSRPPGVLSSASWGDRGGHWAAIVGCFKQPSVGPKIRDRCRYRSREKREQSQNSGCKAAKLQSCKTAVCLPAPGETGNRTNEGSWRAGVPLRQPINVRQDDHGRVSAAAHSATQKKEKKMFCVWSVHRRRKASSTILHIEYPISRRFSIRGWVVCGRNSWRR